MDYNQLHLDKGDSDREGVSDKPTTAKTSDPANQPNTDEIRVLGEWGEPVPCQPRFRMRETEIEIQNMCVFRHDSGQPIQLRAYPYVRPKPAPPSEKRLQAYRGQDRYNPAWTHVRSTRRDRIQALVEAQGDSGTPNANGPLTSTFKVQMYVGENRILQESQPWTGDIGREADYNRLEECDRLVMGTIRGSGQLPRLEGGFNVITPSYLTVVLHRDRAMLTDREAIEHNGLVT